MEDYGKIKFSLLAEMIGCVYVSKELFSALHVQLIVSSLFYISISIPFFQHFFGRGFTMPADEVRQRKGGGRKKSKKGKGKGQGGSPNERSSSSNGQDEALLPPPVVPPKKPVEEKKRTLQAKTEDESSLAICLQVLFPYLLAGMGMVMAGMVLDSVQVGHVYCCQCSRLIVSHFLGSFIAA